MTRKMPKNLKQSQKTAKQLRKEIATWKKANTPGKIPTKKKDMINYIQRNNIWTKWFVAIFTWLVTV